MKLSPNTQAVLLLCGRFTNNDEGDARPLSPTEYDTLAKNLKELEIVPATLLEADAEKLVKKLEHKKVSADRLKRLLGRGAALALSLERWSQTGLWVIGRGDPLYPQSLKKHLGWTSPPILYGAGDPKLLSKGGIATVGSRNADAESLSFARRLGELCSAEQTVLVSGGAKGVDAESMFGALDQEGGSVGVLANDLARAVVSKKYRNYISSGQLTLITPYGPDAGFSVGNAMGRNKLIYVLSDIAVVVHSGTDGGTWAGAQENLKKDWVPLFVLDAGENTAVGNRQLIDAGGHPISIADLEKEGPLLARLLESVPPRQEPDNKGKQLPLFGS